KKVYHDYHSRGLEIVGVSLDEEPDRLAKFVKAKDIPWPQIFFDRAGSRGWENPLARQYDIDSIPAMLVVDQQGKLADYNVRGPQLEAAVAALLDRSPRSAQALTLGQDLLSWIFYAVMQAPLLLVALSALGGALAGIGIEVGIRRV